MAGTGPMNAGVSMIVTTFGSAGLFATDADTIEGGLTPPGTMTCGNAGGGTTGCGAGGSAFGTAWPMIQPNIRTDVAAGTRHTASIERTRDIRLFH